MAFIGIWSSFAYGAITVSAPDATVAGKAIGDWSADWWKWALSFSDTNPFLDTTGANANLDQSGPVFFLAGTPGGASNRSFTIPAGAYVLVPLLVGELSQLEIGFDKTEADIRQGAKDQADLIDSLHATVDGMTVPGLFAYREASPDFQFVSAAENPLGVPPGNSGIAVGDGYFLMLSPPSVGTHEVNFGGSISAFDFSINDTDIITVTPEPGALTLLGLGLAAIFGNAAWKKRRAAGLKPPDQGRAFET